MYCVATAFIKNMHQVFSGNFHLRSRKVRIIKFFLEMNEAFWHYHFKLDLESATRAVEGIQRRKRLKMMNAYEIKSKKSSTDSLRNGRTVRKLSSHFEYTDYLFFRLSVFFFSFLLNIALSWPISFLDNPDLAIC